MKELFDGLGRYIGRKEPQGAKEEGAKMSRTEGYGDMGKPDSPEPPQTEVSKEAFTKEYEDLYEAVRLLGTSLWRMSRILSRPNLDQSDRGRLEHHVEDALHAAGLIGVEIIDHTGDDIPETGVVGLKRLVFEPREDLVRETVIETVRPTIRLAGRQIQMGEVIVGTPIKREGDDTSDD